LLVYGELVEPVLPPYFPRSFTERGFVPTIIGCSILRSSFRIAYPYLFSLVSQSAFSFVALAKEDCLVGCQT